MTRLLTALGLALVFMLPVPLSADEVLEGSYEGVDLFKVTHYDESGVSNKVEFFAKNNNSYDITLKIELKKLTGLQTMYDEDEEFTVGSGERRRVASFSLEEEGGAGNYEFDWSVVPTYEYIESD